MSESLLSLVNGGTNSGNRMTMPSDTNNRGHSIHVSTNKNSARAQHAEGDSVERSYHAEGDSPRQDHGLGDWVKNIFNRKDHDHHHAKQNASDLMGGIRQLEGRREPTEPWRRR